MTVERVRDFAGGAVSVRSRDKLLVSVADGEKERLAVTLSVADCEPNPRENVELTLEVFLVADFRREALRLF